MTKRELESKFHELEKKYRYDMHQFTIDFFDGRINDYENDVYVEQGIDEITELMSLSYRIGLAIEIMNVQMTDYRIFQELDTLVRQRIRILED